jgi:YHS domain-containing protein
MKAIAVIPGQPESIHLADLPKPSVHEISHGRGVLMQVLRVGIVMESQRRNIIKRCSILFILTMCGIWICSINVQAGEFFERNNLAIDGYDPVAYFTERRPVKGSSEFHSDFQGSTFQFVSASHRDAFAEDPSKYVPQYGGFCAYGTAKGYKAVIDPAAFTVVGDKLYLNYSEAVRTRWLSDVPSYLQKADANWPEVKKQTRVHE